MPVIVIGADTPLGAEVLAALARRGGEVRAFVTDAAAGHRLREGGVRVAVGDVSDGSHVSGAALACFSAVLIAEAAGDGRELTFAAGPAAVLEGWHRALVEAGVRRAIWVGCPPPGTRVPETAEVGVAGRSASEVAAEVARLDDAASL